MNPMQFETGDLWADLENLAPKLVAALGMTFGVPALLAVVAVAALLAAMRGGVGEGAGGNLLTPGLPGITASQAVELASTRVGTPYVWGATGPSAFDCSGLVVWAYSRGGSQPPRTAQQQFQWARPVPPGQVRIGDLAFYQNTYSSSDRITHVGIYAGDGLVIMATTPGDVVRPVPLTDPYWRRHFAGFGRPPGPSTQEPVNES